MFQYSGSGAGAPPVATGESPQFEEVRVSIKGSLAGLRVMVKTLHKLGYAEPNDWGKPQPSAVEGEWVTVLIRRVRV
ncbi:MAG: hypothetical protein F6J97_14600 [Leptolyngbya sp. SIO4C1]|nr:hypothetical protein [Leptolyngbya sp. SIO4C1]